ncbi:MAG: DNA-processing protein DprA [Candidatus Halichondribacter symbioticus]
MLYDLSSPDTPESHGDSQGDSSHDSHDSQNYSHPDAQMDAQGESQTADLLQTTLSDTEAIAWLRLTRSSRVGPATFVRLLEEHKNAKDALIALPDIARQAGVRDYQPCTVARAEKEYEQGLELGYKPLFLGYFPYPRLLCETPDAPPFLWARGDLDLLQNPCVALVGARNASSLGQRIAGVIARQLGQFQYGVVSGLARGIDTATHRGALETGTVAVLASGLDVCYPKENADLMEQIGDLGVCLSEQPIGTTPQARHFPQRNRIIAGMCSAVVVVEAATRSGSLITARCAADLGREVMAVPGNPLDGRASGCNALIRDGAVLVRSGQDIHDALQVPADLRPSVRSAQGILNFVPNGFSEGGVQERISGRDAQGGVDGGVTGDMDNSVVQDVVNPKQEPDEEDGERLMTPDSLCQRIFELLGSTSLPEDILIRDSGLPMIPLTQQLTALELEGRIIRQPGGVLSVAV